MPTAFSRQALAWHANPLVKYAQLEPAPALARPSIKERTVGSVLREDTL